MKKRSKDARLVKCKNWEITNESILLTWFKNPIEELRVRSVDVGRPNDVRLAVGAWTNCLAFWGCGWGWGVVGTGLDTLPDTGQQSTGKKDKGEKMYVYRFIFLKKPFVLISFPTGQKENKQNDN